MNLSPKVRPTLKNHIASFLLDRRAKGLAAKTVTFYHEYLTQFAAYCESCGVDDVESVTPDMLRRFLLEYAESHNAGGCHALFRSVRAFLRWYESEFEPPGFKNPLVKVKAPKLQDDPITAVSLEDVFAMVATCRRRRKIDVRDRALLLTLIDTGGQASCSRSRSTT